MCELRYQNIKDKSTTGKPFNRNTHHEDRQQTFTNRNEQGFKRALFESNEDKNAVEERLIFKRSTRNRKSRARNCTDAT